MKKLLIALTLLLLAQPAIAESVKLIKIVDGDTIKVERNGEAVNLRLKGIDCFETSRRKKAFKQAKDHNMSLEEVVRIGRYTKRYLERELRPGTYDIKITETGRYGRPVGYLFMHNGRPIQEDLLRRGYCEVYGYKKYRSVIYNAEFNRAENEAKRKGLGIWR